jgi:YfiR/HmsC-like
VRASSSPRTLPHVAPAAIAVCLAVLPTPAASAQDAPLATAVKATFLYKVAPFVEWPSDAFDSPSSPLNLCIALHDPFGSIVDEAAAGQRTGEHPIAVQRLAAVGERSGCHILYLGAGAGAEAVADALATVRGTPVLTVTDSATDPRTKGIVNFVVENNHVRFEIDVTAAAANRLTISSKLLGLAAAVTTGG